MLPTVLFPSDFYNKNVVDPELRYEYDSCKRLGFKILLFHYQDWYTSHICSLSNTPKTMTTTIYRGWMMKPNEYSLFFKQLQKHNIQLFTSIQEYSNLHIFPNIYPYIQQDTPRILLFPLHKKIDLVQIKSNFSKFLVKDSVKSVKGSSFPSYFDHSVTQIEFDSWMNLFYQYRGTLLTGNICIKEYVSLKRYNGATNEYRVFYLNHKILSISRNSNQSILCPLPSDSIINKYANLPSPFYTIDYAELENGDWIIIECGDGQVSGLSDTQDYDLYFQDLASIIDKK